MENIIDIAINEISQKYNPDTIILYGSRARGDFKESSDIDIACFGKTLSVAKDARFFNGVYLDLWIYPTTAMTSVSQDELRFCDGVVILEKDREGRDYLKMVSEYLAKGPEKLSPSDIAHTKEWIRKMLGRVQDTNIENNYRKIWLQFELLEIYFQLKGFWFLGDKKSFQHLKEHDPKAYTLFKDVYANPENSENLSTLANYVISI